MGRGGGETHEFRVRRAGSAILDFTVVDAGFPVDERSNSKFLSTFPVTPPVPHEFENSFVREVLGASLNLPMNI